MLASRKSMTIVTARNISVLLTLTLILAGVSYGQIKSGIIVGTVLDSSGAAVPDATVAVVNQETNVTISASTDPSGSFTVPYLVPGNVCG